MYEQWEVEHTEAFEAWFATLDSHAQESIVAAVQVLREKGPGLGRPLVDTLGGSRHANMKELRLLGTLRVFFAFDPRRVALLLIGGDKRGKGSRWYEQMLRLADDLYDDHLRQIGGDHG